MTRDRRLLGVFLNSVRLDLRGVQSFSENLSR